MSRLRQYLITTAPTTQGISHRILWSTDTYSAELEAQYTYYLDPTANNWNTIIKELHPPMALYGTTNTAL